MDVPHQSIPYGREAFILRLWRHRPQSDWIIEIQNVRTGEVTHLLGLEGIPEILGEQLAHYPLVPAEDAPPREKDRGG
jgi:hypothetical protein